MDTFVEPTLEWEPLTESDLPSIAELQQAVEYFDDPVNRIGLAELHEWFSTPGAQPHLNGICGRDRRVGDIVAYGWNLVQPPSGGTARVIMVGAVHPGWRDQRIGHSLAAWQLGRAREWAEGLRERPEKLWVGVYTDEDGSGAHRLFRNHGLAPERYFFDMHHVFARVQNPPPPPPVPGIQFVAYTEEWSERVRTLHNGCFVNTVGYSPVDEEQWRATQGRPEFRPEWSWLALDGDQVVGYALNSADEAAWTQLGFSEGWTDRLGVHVDYRRRGIAKGLLSWSMWSFGRAGLEGAGLGIDTVDAEEALAIYRGIGYESAEMVVLLSTTVPLTTR